MEPATTRRPAQALPARVMSTFHLVMKRLCSRLLLPLDPSPLPSMPVNLASNFTREESMMNPAVIASSWTMVFLLLVMELKMVLITGLLRTAGELPGVKRVTSRCPETRTTNVVSPLKLATLWFKDSFFLSTE
ncbi:UNVERIFIED_CONTAM: hypothetical protein NCL1_28795 [Trichonephila clavipes]